MPTAGRLLTSPPFSLVPSDVPSTFQVELTASASSPSGARGLVCDPVTLRDGLLQCVFLEHCGVFCSALSLSSFFRRGDIQQVIQVNVVSGNFSEAVGSSGLPYTYNGLFFVLSIPEFPLFQIRNLTRFTLEFISAHEKLPVSTDANGAQHRRTSRSRYRQRDEMMLSSEALGQVMGKDQIDEPLKKQTARPSRVSVIAEWMASLRSLAPISKQFSSTVLSCTGPPATPSHDLCASR